MRGGAAGGGLSGFADAALLPALTRVAALAAAEPHREVCGFLVGRGDRLEVWPARNVAPDPARTFEAAPADVLAALRRVDDEGLHLAAVYHSHPGGGPALSPRDLARPAPGGAPLIPGADLVVVALEHDPCVRVRIHHWSGVAFAHRDVRIPGSTAG